MRSDGNQAGRRRVRPYAAPVAFAVVLLVSFGVMNLLPSDDLPQACLQEAALAVVALVAAWSAVPDVFKCCTRAVQHKVLLRFTVGAIVLIGVLGGVISLLNWDFLCIDGSVGALFEPWFSVGDLARNLLPLLGICMFTGIYEEAFMRVLGVETFEGAMRQGEDLVGNRADSPIPAEAENAGLTIKRSDSGRSCISGFATKRAVMLSALLFALLHVGAPAAGAGSLVVVQMVLKFLQSFLFGLMMGALYARTRRFWPCAGLHTAFDILYLGPQTIASGALPATYASGTAGETVLLTATVVLLAAAAIAQGRILRRVRD